MRFAPLASAPRPRGQSMARSRTPWPAPGPRGMNWFRTSLPRSKRYSVGSDFIIIFLRPARLIESHPVGACLVAGALGLLLGSRVNDETIRRLCDVVGHPILGTKPSATPSQQSDMPSRSLTANAYLPQSGVANEIPTCDQCLDKACRYSL
jgi:hypothetical protein